MATLIPGDLDRKGGVAPHELFVAKTLSSMLPEDDWIWYNSAAHSPRPRFVVVSPRHGVLGIDTYDWSPVDVEIASQGVMVSGNQHDPVSALGRRLEDLRQKLTGMKPAAQISGLIVLPNFRGADLEEPGLSSYLGSEVAISGEELANGGLGKVLPRPRKTIAPGFVAEVRARLYPDTQFERPRLVHDDDRSRRATLRLQLDGEQEAVARSLTDGVTLVSGVSGSGKSLVLCGRARYLASEHPDWTIQMLCFNKTLVRYLENLVGRSNPGVQVDTFFRWATRLGLRLPWAKDDDDEKKADDVIREAIRKGLGAASCDAILIDEGQDFAASWLAFARQALRPDRGGMVIASDRAQSIYRNDSLVDALGTEEIASSLFRRNYRNTKQIGQFAAAAVFGSSGAPRTSSKTSQGRDAGAPEFFLDGEPVQMVWGEKWDAQAEFIAREIKRLVGERRAAYRDIAVLYTQRSGMTRRILEALEVEAIPNFWVNRDSESKGALDPQENSVKVMTIHSGKGMEFPIIFVFGIEALKVPAQLVSASEEEWNKTRLAYVGFTRAQDVLYLTYTRSNPIIDRALELKKWSEFRSYPDDFDFD